MLPIAILCSTGLTALSVAEAFLRQGVFGPEKIPLETVSIIVGGCAFFAILLTASRNASSAKRVIMSGVFALCAWMFIPPFVLTIGSPAPPADSVAFFFIATMVSFAGSLRFIAGVAAAAVFAGVVLRGDVERTGSSGDA